MVETVYSEDQLQPLSALQHLAFCERQCALIHVEQVWAENRLTVKGEILHDKVHEADAESLGVGIETTQDGSGDCQIWWWLDSPCE